MCTHNATCKRMRRESTLPKIMDGRERVTRIDDHSQTGCGVIGHNQTEVLSPNATVGVVDCGEHLQWQAVKIQKNSERESHATTGSHPSGRKANWRKDCRALNIFKRGERL